MPEPQAIQAVVTAPDEINLNKRIEQIFLYNSDGTPYEGGGPGVGRSGAVIITDTIGDVLTKQDGPANMTSGWSFGSNDNPYAGWVMTDRAVALPNVSASDIVGGLTITIPYNLTLPVVASGTHAAIFVFYVDLYADDTFITNRGVAHTIPIKDTLLLPSVITGDLTLITPLTIPEGGCDLEVRITNGLIKGSATFGGSPILQFPSPRFMFVGN